MNATFSLPLVIFCHIYRPHPHGITVVSVPITTVLPLTLSPFLQYYRNFRPHYCGYRGFTAVPIPMQLSSIERSLTDKSILCCKVSQLKCGRHDVIFATQCYQ